MQHKTIFNFQISEYIESCQNEARIHQRRQEHNQNLNLILKEIENVAKRTIKMKEDIVNLESRLGELTSTLKQMIVNGQIVIIIYKIILLHVIYILPLFLISTWLFCN